MHLPGAAKGAFPDSKSETRRGRIRGEIKGAHLKEGGVGSRSRLGWLVVLVVVHAGGRCATCLKLNVRDSGKKSEFVSRLVLSFGKSAGSWGRVNGRRCQQDVVAPKRRRANIYYLVVYILDDARTTGTWRSH